jgi:hypothetical protein
MPLYGGRSKKTVPEIVTVPGGGGGGGVGHFFVRLASPDGDGLPGSFTHTFFVLLLVDAVSCARDTFATNGVIASASTTNEPRMVDLLLMTYCRYYDYHDAGKANHNQMIPVTNSPFRQSDSDELSRS